MIALPMPVFSSSFLQYFNYHLADYEITMCGLFLADRSSSLRHVRPSQQSLNSCLVPPNQDLPIKRTPIQISITISPICVGASRRLSSEKWNRSAARHNSTVHTGE